MNTPSTAASKSNSPESKRFEGQPSRAHPALGASLYNQLLLTASQRDRIDVVLVAPRNPLNIGAVARAMANFGLQRLAVVASFAPSWREARSAVGAPELLLNAREFATLGEAVAEATLVLGTGTLTSRKAEQPVVALPDLNPHVTRKLAGGGRIALVFGPENHGLSRDDLSWCHRLVEIPTDSGQPSMNLGQAVAVCLYELAVRGGAAEEVASSETADADFDTDSGAERSVSKVASGDLNLLAEVIGETMRSAGYSPSSMQPANRHDLRLLLRRLTLGPRDLRRALGLFRRILWRLEHGPRR